MNLTGKLPARAKNVNHVLISNLMTRIKLWIFNYTCTIEIKK